MPTLPFNKQFADKVERGEKRQTIRKRRKHPIKVGDPLYLYTGMRTKHCRQIGEETCGVTFPVRRMKRGDWRRDNGWGYLNDPYSTAGLRELARLDGFESVDDFEDWFDAHCGPNELLDVIRW